MDGGWIQVQGPLDLAFCNFLAGWNLTDETAAEGAERVAYVCSDRPGMSVFVCTGDSPANMGWHLIQAGFELRHTLIEMAFVGTAPNVPGALHLAQGKEERKRISDFMTRQFFWRGSYEQRRCISDATSSSPHQLYYFGEAMAPTGAIMLVPTDNSLGIYNLCVQESLRGQGIGSQVLSLALMLADHMGVPAVLQCEQTLCGWYSKHGFRQIGAVDAYRLPEPAWFPAI